jgi:hypothetical protein
LALSSGRIARMVVGSKVKIKPARQIDIRGRGAGICQTSAESEHPTVAGVAWLPEAYTLHGGDNSRDRRRASGLTRLLPQSGIE